MARQNFIKAERLCSKMLTDKLFEPGIAKSASAWPLRVVYRLIDDMDDDGGSATDKHTAGKNEERPQLLISVPKRLLHHAVERNKVKRQIREAYRCNRHLIYLPQGKKLLLALIWLDSKTYSSAVVQKKTVRLLTMMSERVMRDEGLSEE